MTVLSGIFQIIGILLSFVPFMVTYAVKRDLDRAYCVYLNSDRLDEISAQP